MFNLNWSDFMGNDPELNSVLKEAAGIDPGSKQEASPQTENVRTPSFQDAYFKQKINLYFETQKNRALDDYRKSVKSIDKGLQIRYVGIGMLILAAAYGLHKLFKG